MTSRTYAPATIISLGPPELFDLSLHICTRRYALSASKTAHRIRAAEVLGGRTVPNSASSRGDCVQIRQRYHRSSTILDIYMIKSPSGVRVDSVFIQKQALLH